MTQPVLIPGLLRSLARDGWWLDAPTSVPPDVSLGEGRSTRGPHWAGLAGLVALADLLFWHHAPGLSLALFALAILGVAAAGSGRLSVRPVVQLAFAAAPVVEHLQALSLALTAAWLRRLPGHWLAPLSLRAGLLGHISRPSRVSQSARKALRDWPFPLAGSLVFLSS
ncbi:hypothetical protein C8J30_11478 [Rhodobacter viridis]|uniref:Uncharacterized protein n=1 Tax=Rhodobacter viridis TaxID=1054202 RepID=A0A318TW83_9RHOB|nr:hypothetical protein [Rhodobacter viridis]PYF08140.1 hypothetical protein C8J30_11478 [Rhodobacter viridis]